MVSKRRESLEPLIAEYKETLQLTKKQLEKCTIPEDAEMLTAIVSELKYAILYMQKGYDPRDRSAGLHLVEQVGSYHNRRLLIENFLESVYGKEDDLEILGFVPDCERTLTDEQKELINYCLSQLTERQLTCFLLHTCHMRTFEQIGEELGISKSSVQNHVERAREHAQKAASEVLESCEGHSFLKVSVTENK